MMNRVKLSGRLALLTVLGLTLGLGTLLPATEAVAQGEPYMELLRKDLETDKIAIMTAALELTEEQGEVFWPIYREFENERAEIGDQTYALVKEYAENYLNMDPDKAKKIMEQVFTLNQKKLDIHKKYFKKVSKALDPIIAARFIQVDRQIQALITVQVNSQIPLIEETAVPAEG